MLLNHIIIGDRYRRHQLVDQDADLVERSDLLAMLDRKSMLVAVLARLAHAVGIQLENTDSPVRVIEILEKCGLETHNPESLKQQTELNELEAVKRLAKRKEFERLKEPERSQKLLEFRARIEAEDRQKHETLEETKKNFGVLADYLRKRLISRIQREQFEARRGKKADLLSVVDAHAILESLTFEALKKPVNAEGGNDIRTNPLRELETTVYEVIDRTWEHLNFPGQYQGLLAAPSDMPEQREGTPGHPMTVSEDDITLAMCFGVLPIGFADIIQNVMGLLEKKASAGTQDKKPPQEAIFSLALLHQIIVGEKEVGSSAKGIRVHQNAWLHPRHRISDAIRSEWKKALRLFPSGSKGLKKRTQFPKSLQRSDLLFQSPKLMLDDQRRAADVPDWPIQFTIDLMSLHGLAEPLWTLQAEQLGQARKKQLIDALRLGALK